MTNSDTRQSDANADPGESAATGETGKIRVLDLINTHECAKELLDHRVAQVNASGRFQNDIYCSSGPYVEYLRRRGHTVHVVDTPRNLNPLGMAGAIWHTYRLLRRQRYDLVHTHTSTVGFIGRAAAVLARVPVIIHQVHGFHHTGQMSEWKRKIFVAAERFLGRFTHELLFQAREELNDCVQRRIAPAEKLLAIGNGVQLDTFDPQAEPQSDPPLVVCVGRFEAVKNHHMLLEVARILKDRGVAFRVQLVGDGDLRQEYENWVLESDLTDRVEFLGYRDDVPALIGNASLCVLVSIKEGVPRALIEAAAGGRPAVATNVPSSYEAIVDGETGFLVPLNDTAAFADRMETLLTDQQLRQRMGQRALQQAREQFDERVITDRIMAVYDRWVADRVTH